MLKRHLFSLVLRHPYQFLDQWNLLNRFLSTTSTMKKHVSLDLEEVQKVLNDVKADDVRVIHVSEQCDWTDHVVIATGRSTWHVKNIAQALLHKAYAKEWWRTRVEQGLEFGVGMGRRTSKKVVGDGGFVERSGERIRLDLEGRDEGEELVGRRMRME